MRPHRITLPADYRFFVTAVGNGGAGPGYGVFSLGEFVMSGQRFSLPRLDVRFRPAQGTAGALPVGEQGCAISHWLGLSGPERGIVWTDARANDGGFHPATVPHPYQILRRRQTFSAWYCTWLDSMLDKYQP
ncbi:MAG: hypothetical protein AAFV53_17130 [Myxococcota bacterium]